MGKLYSVNGENLSLGTGAVLIALRTAADGITRGGILEIHEIEISQNATATGAQCRGEVFTRDTAGTLTMTSATPAPLVLGSSDASGITGSTAPAGTAARVGINSSADSGGTYSSRMSFNFNNLEGWFWESSPKKRIIIPPAIVAGVRFVAAPATTTGWTFRFVYEELA